MQNVSTCYTLNAFFFIRSSITCLLSTSLLFCQGQSVISKTLVRDHRPNGSNYQRFQITEMRVAENNGKYKKALEQQDVIGNDFFGDQEIGTVKNKNDDGSHTPTDFKPVDGHKRTFCGRIKEYYWSNGSIDKDLGVYLDVPATNELLTEHQHFFNEYGNFENNWNVIEAEINIQEQSRKYYKLPYRAPNTEYPFNDRGCAYGPWVMEIKDNSENLGAGNVSQHKNNNEIHPAEQIWWKSNSIENYIGHYVLGLFVDNSGRFDEVGDYVSNIGVIPLYPEDFKPWNPGPLEGIFAIAFEIDLSRKERAFFTIGTEVAKNAGLQSDGKKHYLIFQTDTLAIVDESFYAQKDYVSIDFLEVGYDPIQFANGNRNVIRGFLAIKGRIDRSEFSILDNRTTRAGNLKVVVQKQIMSSIRASVRVTIEKIERLEKNSYRGTNEVTQAILTAPSPVPKFFDEKGLRFKFGNIARDLQLEKSNELTLNYVQSWNGTVTDRYKYLVTCKSKDGKYLLGEFTITGYPDQSFEQSTSTILVYKYNAPPGLPRTIVANNENDSAEEGNEVSNTIRMFKITYKVERLSVALPKTQ